MAKVCIDPGHAGAPTDSGAVNSNTGLQEADVVLSIAKKLEVYLNQVGIETLLTRTAANDPTSDDLGYRTNISDEWGADLFVSIHCNSAGSAEAVGTEIWTSKGQTEGDVLATCIMNQVTQTFPELPLRADWADGDVDKESNFYVLRYTDAPACLLETAFISNDEEAALLADDAWQDKMAAAIARGVTDYLAKNQ
ncbi:MAG: N-acetylmuramoyl-L-alanine amidase [Sporomusaceae bacterium]|nr:N-acetylmuramoyl-L-alanine amidase [Sporomusaceae bacterium]